MLDVSQLDRGEIASLVLNKTGPFILKDDLEDIISDVMVKAIERQDYYDPEKSALGTWLYMLVNDVIYKRHQSTDALDVADIALDELSEGEDGELTSAYDGLDPDKILDDNCSHYYLKNRAKVDEALARVPNEYRRVLKRKLLYGLSHDEIADELGISVDNSRQVFSRGVAMLRAVVGTEYHEPRAINRLTKQVNQSPQLSLASEFDRAEYSLMLDEMNARHKQNEREFYLALDRLDEFTKNYTGE